MKVFVRLLAALGVVLMAAQPVCAQLPGISPFLSSQWCTPASVNATLLTHLDGYNAGTSPVDIYGHSVTATNAQLSNTTVKFDATAATNTGTTAGNGFNFGNGSTDFAFGTGDFTVDFWYYANATDAANTPVVIGLGSDAGGLWFRFGSGSANSMAFYWNSIGNDTATAVSLNTWHHFAASRVGSNIRVFVDGVVKLTLGAATHSNTVGLMIGGRNAGTASSSISSSGFVDEVRVIKGTGYWSSGFTVPDRPWCN